MQVSSAGYDGLAASPGQRCNEIRLAWVLLAPADSSPSIILFNLVSSSIAARSIAVAEPLGARLLSVSWVPSHPDTPEFGGTVSPAAYLAAGRSPSDPAVRTDPGRGGRECCVPMIPKRSSSRRSKTAPASTQVRGLDFADASAAVRA